MAKDDLEFYSIEEIMALMGVKQARTVYRWIRAGKLKAFKAGRQWRVTREALDEFVRTQQTTGGRESRT